MPRGLQNLTKSYENCDATWLGIWKPLGTNLGGFYGQVGRQVGAKLAYLGGLILSYLTLSYEILGGAGWSGLTLVILGILTSRVRLTGNVWGQQVSLGNTPDLPQLEAKLALVKPKLAPRIFKNRSGGLPKSDHIFDCKWGRVLLPFYDRRREVVEKS